MGETVTGEEPAQHSLHTLVNQQILAIPDFTLLEEARPKSVEDLMDIMEGVGELCQRGFTGVAHRRIAHSGRWGIVGEYPENWISDSILGDPHTKGIYLSPQQIMQLSQGGDPTDCDLTKADMFAFGIMLIEIVFGESMGEIFDYENFEIKLKPLLTKLNTLRQEFGEALYEVFLRMLELDENQRIDFDEFMQMMKQARKPARIETSYMSNSNSSYASTNTYRTNKSPLRRKPQPVYRNDVSPLRGAKFIERERTPERTGTPGRLANKSPLKRDLRINTRFEKENSAVATNGNFTSRSPYKPMLLRKGGVSPLSRR